MVFNLAGLRPSMFKSFARLVDFRRADRHFQVPPFVQRSPADLRGQAGPPCGLRHRGLHAVKEDDGGRRHAADAVAETGEAEPLVEGERSLPT